MSDDLVQRVARAMSRIDWCGAKIGDEFCLCDDPRLPHEVRAGECFCRMKAPAAIAVVLEEAAKVAENASFHFTQTTPSTVEVVDVRHTIAAAIRALVKT